MRDVEWVVRLSLLALAGNAGERPGHQADLDWLDASRHYRQAVGAGATSRDAEQRPDILPHAVVSCRPCSGGVVLVPAILEDMAPALVLGTGGHLVLDSMWLTPRTLLWPAYGLAFERVDLTNWAQGLLHGLVTSPAVYVPEIIRAIVLR